MARDKILRLLGRDKLAGTAAFAPAFRSVARNRQWLLRNRLMSRLVVRSVGMSIDGYSAGPNQSLDNPLGVNGPELMDWLVHTRVWREMHQQPGGDAGVDNEIAKQGFE